MKALLRWIGKTICSIVVLLGVIVLLPYASKFAASVLPDESGSAIKASVVIASKLQESARLETMTLEEEGTLNYDIQAAFLGSVGNVNVRYKYNASFGIDLSKVKMTVNGDAINFLLPQPEVIQDSLTPLEAYRNDFWFPGFSDDDYNRLLETERHARRESHLSGEKLTKLQQTSQNMFEKTIASWLKDVNGHLIITYGLLDETDSTE